jgi:hypothetical protein
MRPAWLRLDAPASEVTTAAAATDVQPPIWEWPPARTSRWLRAWRWPVPSASLWGRRQSSYVGSTPGAPVRPVSRTTPRVTWRLQVGGFDQQPGAVLAPREICAILLP